MSAAATSTFLHLSTSSVPPSSYVSNQPLRHTKTIFQRRRNAQRSTKSYTINSNSLQFPFRSHSTGLPPATPPTTNSAHLSHPSPQSPFPNRLNPVTLGGSGAIQSRSATELLPANSIQPSDGTQASPRKNEEPNLPSAIFPSRPSRSATHLRPPNLPNQRNNLSLLRATSGPHHVGDHHSNVKTFISLSPTSFPHPRRLR